MEPKGNISRFGLRYFGGGEECRLLEISGGGRIRIGAAPSTRKVPPALSDAEIEWLWSEPREALNPFGHIKRQWWSAPAPHMNWEVYETTEGETFDSRHKAEQVAKNLCETALRKKVLKR